MDHKESYVVAIFVITFALFLFLVNPSYSGYVSLDNCSISVISCSDYNETECTEDICGFSCDWNTTDCIIYIEDVSYTVPDLTGTISTIQSLINDTEKVAILQILGIDVTTTISTLGSYELQIQNTDADPVLTNAEKATAISGLEIQIDTLLANIPEVLTITNKISGLPSPPPVDITRPMIPQGLDVDLDEVYSVQDQVETRTDLTSFSMLTFSGEATQGTYIKKTVSSPLQDGFIIEIIPVIASEQELDFLGAYTTVSTNPFIVSIPMSGGSALYSYIIKQDVALLIDQIQTAAIPYDVNIEPVIKVVCGDGICTELLEDRTICPEDCAKKIPWTILIIILIVIVAGILFIHFFKNKGGLDKLKGIIKRKPKVENLFNTETDKENLKNYVLHSINEGVSSGEIKVILLKKGWTKEQVELILDEIRQESQPKKETPPPEEQSSEPREQPSEESSQSL